MLRARIRRAQLLLKSTDDTIDRAADQVGFGSLRAFRECFKRVVGTSPQSSGWPPRSRIGLKGQRAECRAGTEAVGGQARAAVAAMAATARSTRGNPRLRLTRCPDRPAPIRLVS
ncbi:helix-turn-helix domain-containing protein [Streptomyces sp. NPDC086549]|uniref:helix-turn-helix domain-containing protein n=1 Tax=Streptomyces sp. NPDC086549 TaxID=3365752 RepID=UPI00382FD941